MYQSSTRAPTLHQWDITDSSLLPMPQQKRKLTDVICLVLAFLFGLILLIVAIALHNGNNLTLTQYPSDSNGVVCMLNAQNNYTKYPFLYFNDLQNPQKNRYCVEECPEQGVLPKCFGNCSINYYPNYPSISSLGSICLPEDDNLKAKLLSDANLGDKFNAIKAITYLFTGLGVSFGLSILWMLLVQFQAKMAIWAIFFLSAALLIIASITFFAASGTHLAENQSLAIFLGIVFIILLILLVYYACLYRKQLSLSACFLYIAGDCLKSNLSSLLYILMFIALTFLFCILIIYQYLSFSSSKAPTLNGVFYQTQKNGFLTFLLVIEAIWGLSFFRDAFNYIVSGIADEWYFHKLNMFCYSLKRLFTKNLGSVAGGSFLSGFFYLPALLISFLTPRENFCLCNFFDLTRSDVYAYIYLTGNSYCPSSRQAQYLCFKSRICRQNESVLALYAFFTRIAISLTSVMIIYWVTRDNLVNQKVPFVLLAGVFFICLYVSCYFIDIHVNMAEALMICFLTEYDLEEGWSYKEMRACPEKLSRLIIDIENKGEQEQVQNWD